jgi:hypothetical protein
MIQTVEHFPSKHKALISNTRTSGIKQKIVCYHLHIHKSVHFIGFYYIWKIPSIIFKTQPSAYLEHLFRWKIQCCIFSNFSLVVLGFDLKASCLLGRHYYLSQSTSPVFSIFLSKCSVSQIPFLPVFLS